MIGQIGNEITVGTAIGFADLADAFYNMVSNSPNDYQSEISSELESLKESINERLAIYREILMLHLILEILLGGLVMLLV